ncbi:dihydrofolate reductase family protein [Pleomorphomonas oryzae]|uniref:dihydrofolate reductase family protein n=1 Tax=Pleomorphomonas oryzae TaxID=261934 RepID=UPI000403A297|nr:dihydrofolate reductase family protein [Pleomorphomonas oryzae]
MAKLVFALNQSLDGYVDDMTLEPDPVLFRHFIDDMRAMSGCIYGRRMYELMRYWDDERPDWDNAERDFAAAWRSRPKWVVSRTLEQVGPNARLIRDDVEATVRNLKAQRVGTLEVAGPELAASLSPLIDEYRLYLHPVVIGSGKPFFAAPRPPLRLVANERIGESVVRLVYVPR